MNKFIKKHIFRYKNAGFTLIELLVVVLIIGILASVAVPQYQAAVEKARVARMLPLFKSILNAQEVYKLANSVGTSDLDLLDISVDYVSKQEVENKKNYVLADGSRFSVYDSGAMIVTSFPAGYIIDYYGESSRGGSGLCYPKTNGGLAERVCKSMGTKREAPSSMGTNTYIFNY